MKLNSVKFKIGILYTAILGAILILYSIFLYTTLYQTLYSELDDELRIKAESIISEINGYVEKFGTDENDLILAARKVITLEGIQSRVKTAQAVEADWLKKYDKLDLSQDFIHFVSLDGESFIKSKNLEKNLRVIFLNKLIDDSKKDYVYQKIKFRGTNLRIIQAPFYINGEPEYVIQVATSQKPVFKLLEKRKFIFFISIPVLLLLAVFIGLRFSSRLMLPIVEITETAKEISYKDLSKRLKSQYPDEEIRLLVKSFNDMIERLEKSFKHIEEFSSHVAHELKTPIAIMRGECEIALKKTRSPEEYQRVLQINLEESQRMLKTVEDLLLLAKLDYRPEIFKFEPFDLIKFFEELFEKSRVLASEKNIEVKLSLPKPPLEAVGDRLHLRRLFFNIVHNSIKFTPKEGSIALDVKREESRLIASISDNGIGIHPDDLPKVFDQFFQKENPHSEPSEPSNGLGLNIALSIARLHQGDIKVQSLIDQGTTFIVILPILSQPD